MSISGLHSGYAIMQQSANMVEEAAVEINQLAKNEPQLEQEMAPISDLSFNQLPTADPLQKEAVSEPMPSHSDALVKLTQSASYNRVGASVVERQNEAIGSLLDIHI
ncbi:hypothetical protein LZI70_15585 [Vibrio pelagius]|uniref:Flagellar basal-body/hook protein C-terminal domain-containing protein n=1 Tax=Vibrio pelagius TaxID=28169 RepID=A0ABY5GAV7_VIBPE|nr:hypothetical protein [Vibrio pelagius]UTT86846.1 hypothetical protein LZI70_15585 [Vibrio pelagius]